MPEIWEQVEGGKPLSQDELRPVAAGLLSRFPDQRVWLFHGEMGAGKTTLIKIMAEILDVEVGMSSPTFSIINEYPRTGGDVIYHFDFYRLRQEQEAFDIGTDEYFDSGNFCFVEWPEKIPSLIPDKRMEIMIMPDMDPGHRILQYRTHD